MTLAEHFSAAGVPTFIPDMKGDILALARSCPTIAYDLFGESGLPLSVAVDNIGPELMSRSLSLSDSQAGVLDVADVYAPRAGMPLKTINDLRRVLAAMVANRHSVSANIGLVSPVSVGAIQRALLRLERRGGGSFFRSRRFPFPRCSGWMPAAAWSASWQPISSFYSLTSTARSCYGCFLSCSSASRK